MKDGHENKRPLAPDGGEKDDEERDGGSGIVLGLCFGSAVGLLVQVITGNIIWLPIGMAVGSGLGFAIGSSGKKGE